MTDIIVTNQAELIVDLYSIDKADPATWCALTGVTVDDTIDGAALPDVAVSA